MAEKTISLAEAKANLSQLTDLAAQGESVIITKHGKPVARVSPPEVKRQPIRISELKALTDKQTSATSSDVVRLLRDSERY